MALKIGIVNQKGGAGKTTTARALAVAYALSGWKVLIADFDLRQTTAVEWNTTRLRDKIRPRINAMPADKPRDIDGAGYDLVVMDGRPFSDKATLDIAKASDFIVIPSGSSEEELRPSFRLGLELLKQSIAAERFCFALPRCVSDGAGSAAVAYLRNDPRFSVSAQTLLVKPGYEIAHNKGLSAVEAPFPTLKERGEAFAAELIKIITETTHG